MSNFGWCFSCIIWKELVTKNCPYDFKRYYYRQYVDDTFVLFTSPGDLEAFQNFLNGRDANMSFTIEIEKQNRMPFFDVQIIHEDKTFTTSVYHKPTSSDVYTYFDRFLLISLITFSQLVVGASEYAQVRLNYILNYFF